jgi:hypothetical protein
MIFDPFVAMIFDAAVAMIFDHAVINKFDLRVKILRPCGAEDFVECPTHFDPSEPTLRRLF